MYIYIYMSRATNTLPYPPMCTMVSCCSTASDSNASSLYSSTSSSSRSSTFHLIASSVAVAPSPYVGCMQSDSSAVYNGCMHVTIMHIACHVGRML